MTEIKKHNKSKFVARNLKLSLCLVKQIRIDNLAQIG